MGANLAKGSQRVMGLGGGLGVWEGLKGSQAQEGLGSGKGHKGSRKGAWGSRGGLGDSGVTHPSSFRRMWNLLISARVELAW